MKGEKLLLALMFVMGYSFAASASIKSVTGATVSLLYTGDPTDPKYLYMDAAGPNPDVVLELCDLGQKYVMVGYGANVSGSILFVGLSYSSATQSMAYTDVTGFSSGCYRVSSGGAFVISPSHMTLTPEVFKAALPGKLWVMYSDSPTGSNPGYLFMGDNGVLAGGYTFPGAYYRDGFSQDENKIVFPSGIYVRFQTSSIPFQKLITDSTFGINGGDYRKAVFAVCDDSDGQRCYSGTIVDNPSAFPVKLDTGASPIDDAHVYHRYAVINGFGTLVCIGPEISVSGTVDKNTVIWSDNITYTFTVRNVGNVNITRSFNVVVKLIDPNGNAFMSWNFVVNGLPAGASYTNQVVWQAFNHSGTYRFEVDADPANTIAEWEDEPVCGPLHSEPSSASTTFTLKDAKMLTIYIDGQKVAYWSYSGGSYIPMGYENLSFERAGKPYNLTVHVASTDELYEPNPVPIVGAKLEFIEINGMSPFIPLQVWNSTLHGVNTTFYTRTETRVSTYTDDKGDVSLTVIPTGNKYLLEEYTYLGVKNITGGYVIQLRGYYDNNPLDIVVKPATFTNYLNFSVQDMHYSTPQPSVYLHEQGFLRGVVSWLAQVLGAAWRAMIR